ncbi:hypothetical protein J6590_047586 [Homalodisca vitripennis]|nr:hypothetical protein J6590_047586 [Homalodisca vitripennis]
MLQCLSVLQMDNRFGYHGMDYNLRPPLPTSLHHNHSPISASALPYIYYPGLSKPVGGHKAVRSPVPAPPVSVGVGPAGPSGGSRSFAAALRNLAKQAGPATGERDGEMDGRSSPKRPPPPPLVRGPTPPTTTAAVKLPDKERNSEQRSGFQPYRPEESRVPPPGVPPPHYALEYPPYHPHPSLYPPPHLQHYRVKRRLPHQNTTIQSEMAAHNVLHNVYLKQAAISDWINLLRCGLRHSTLLSDLFQMRQVQEVSFVSIYHRCTTEITVPHMRGRRSVSRRRNMRHCEIAVSHQICEVYGQNAMSDSMVRRWVRQFNEGHSKVHDEEQSGLPSLVTEELVHTIDDKIQENRKFTISALAMEFPQIS